MTASSKASIVATRDKSGKGSHRVNTGAIGQIVTWITGGGGGTVAPLHPTSRARATELYNQRDMLCPPVLGCAKYLVEHERIELPVGPVT